MASKCVERVEPFLAKLERLVGQGLDIELAALIGTAEGASMWDEAVGHVARLADLRRTLPSPPSNVVDAYGLLEDLEQRVIRELHERSATDGRCFPAPPSPLRPIVETHS